MAVCTGIPRDGFHALQDHGILTCHGTAVKIPYHNATGLPIIFGSALNDSSPSTKSATAFPAALKHPHNSLQGPSAQKQNLTNSQCLKLLMHERFNHRNMETISQWKRCGLLPVDPSVAACPDPIYTACQMGKAHRKNHASTKGSIAANCHFPSDGVSANQLEAGHPGKIPTTKGLPTLKQYKYCNLWVDHYLWYIYPTFYKTKHAAELIQSNKEFQSFDAWHNVTICRIRRWSCSEESGDSMLQTSSALWREDSYGRESART